MLRRSYSQQQHSIVFQTPLQRSVGYTIGGVPIPRQLYRPNWNVSNKALMEQVYSADLFCVPVGPGDLLIMGTDGIGDNLSTHQLLQTANTTSIPPMLAQNIVEAALSTNQKPDDTTVIVANIEALLLPLLLLLRLALLPFQSLTAHAAHPGICLRISIHSGCNKCSQVLS